MKIKKVRVRNIWPYLNLIGPNEKFYIGLSELSPHLRRLKRIGFSENLTEGEQILPFPLGRVSKYNASGKYLIQKNKPLETAYRQVDWHWKDWGGNDHSKIVDVPYKR